MGDFNVLFGRAAARQVFQRLVGDVWAQSDHVSPPEWPDTAKKQPQLTNIYAPKAVLEPFWRTLCFATRGNLAVLLQSSVSDTFCGRSAKTETEKLITPLRNSTGTDTCEKRKWRISEMFDFWRLKSRKWEKFEKSHFVLRVVPDWSFDVLNGLDKRCDACEHALRENWKIDILVIFSLLVSGACFLAVYRHCDELMWSDCAGKSPKGL